MNRRNRAFYLLFPPQTPPFCIHSCLPLSTLFFFFFLLSLKSYHPGMAGLPDNLTNERFHASHHCRIRAWTHVSKRMYTLYLFLLSIDVPCNPTYQIHSPYSSVLICGISSPILRLHHPHFSTLLVPHFFSPLPPQQVPS